MLTNTPVGVLRAVLILPSCLDFTVVHRLLRQTSTCRDNGLNQLRDRRLCLDHGQHGSNDASEHKNPLLLRGFTPTLGTS